MLRIDQIAIHPVGDGHEFLMRALFDLGAVLEDDNMIRFADGRQSVGDHDRRSALRHAVKSGLHDSLAVHIDGAGGFVQDQDRWPFDDATGDCQPLALAAAQLDAALTDYRRVPLEKSEITNYMVERRKIPPVEDAR